MTSSPIFDHFLAAQAPIWPRVILELQSGYKKSHWMWFFFPQLRGLGRSETARFYGIASLEEAALYIDHPVLGERLKLCTQLVLALQGRDAHGIFGTPDDLKFRSCMTLFSRVAEKAQENPFQRALNQYFDGIPDALTLQMLG